MKSSSTQEIKISPIGFMRSPFPDKFGVPRRSGLIKELKGVIELTEECSQSGVEKGLDSFTHLWVLFIFHEYAKLGEWSPVVRPPRLGGNKKMGVFASRSPQRPNFTGMSAVKIEKIDRINGRVLIHVSGIDMIDGTPIIDLKPYISDSDAITEAGRGWIEHLPPKKSNLEVEISKEVSDFVEEKIKNPKDFILLLIKIIAQDPRPSYYRSNPSDARKNDFAFSFDGHDIGFVMDGDLKAKVTRIKVL